LVTYIKFALTLKMPNINKKLENILFMGYGPLSSFRSKIDLAFALGILDKYQHEDKIVVRSMAALHSSFSRYPD